MPYDDPRQRPVEELPHVGIAVCQINPDQRHIGILYRTSQNEVRLCHLAFHFDLRDQQIDSAGLVQHGYVWTESGLDSVNASYLAAFCSTIHPRNEHSIPYGFTFNGECFDQNGRYIDPPGRGLTCATFVIGVFHSQSYKFIRLEDWLPDEENIAWQQSMINIMRENDADDAHVDAVSKDLGAARYLPEEVGGSVERPESDWAIGRADAQTFAAELLALLRAAYQ